MFLLGFLFPVWRVAHLGEIGSLYVFVWDLLTHLSAWPVLVYSVLFRVASLSHDGAHYTAKGTSGTKLKSTLTGPSGLSL